MAEDMPSKAGKMPGAVIAAILLVAIIAFGSYFAGYSNRSVKKPELEKPKAIVSVAPKTITPTEKVSPAEESPTVEPTAEPEPTATPTIAPPTTTPAPRITFQLKSPLEIITSPTPTIFLNKNIFKKIGLP